MRDWHIIGVGTGWGARNMGTADGPKVLLSHIPPSFQKFSQSLTNWHGQEPLNFSNPMPLPTNQAKKHGDHIFEMVTSLSIEVQKSFREGYLPLILGGDHSMAIGTWSGVKAAVGDDEIGLIWIDAHMDAHTPETSPSLNIHGMPLATLLGQGEKRFTSLAGIGLKLKPENLCLIGIRSFEQGEEELVKRLGVKVYFMKEVQERGFVAVFEEARRKFAGRRFGLSIDVDAFDPEEAPGTGTREAFGLRLKDTKSALCGLAQDPAFLALEIAEFNPHLDMNNKTCQLVWELIATVTGDNNDKK
ncbi:MAG: arginase [Candidatus Paracaedibacter sp.]